MGFFGNIGDTSKIHFQFDKIYNTRYEMDQAAAAGNDGVFSGRFVLVRYDINDLFFASSIKNAYYYEGHMYSDSEHTIPLYFTTFSLVNSPRESDWNSYFYKQGDYYYKLPSEEYFSSDERNYYIKDASQNNVTYAGEIIRAFDNTGNPSQNYYYCAIDNTNGTIANFIDVYSENNNQFLENNLYFQNYQIDRIHYGTDLDWHGYDATVWQKVYSEGNGKFILIARLSATAPSIELIADAPSTTPSGAYIDNLSSDVKYRIHMPSNWGFRIKEVQTNEETEELVSPSDQQVIQTYYEYDDNNQLISEVNKQINADIYFNKDGSIRATRHYDDNTQNEILITPTGESGKVYYDSNGQRQTIDTYELAIHLPIIGNLLSDFYDIFYGQDRKLDTEWYNGGDTRAITGDAYLNGKTRDLNTVAGLINTFQDRLGQIIKPVYQPLVSTQDVENLEPDYIYCYINTVTGQRTFYRIDYGYNFSEIIENAENGVVFDNVGHLSEQDYEPNNFYVLDNNTFKIAQYAYSYYANDIDFYRKNITTKKYEEVELIKYQPNTYFYKEQNNYILDTNQDVPSSYLRTYYLISSENEQTHQFNNAYEPDLFYTLDNGNYLLEHNERPDATKTYYSFSYTQQTDNVYGRRLYRPNIYYYYDNYVNGQPVGKPKLDTGRDENNNYVGFIPTRQYWFIPLSDELIYVYDNTSGQVVIGHALDESNKQQVYLWYPNGVNIENIFAKIDDNFIALSNLPDYTVEYQWYALNDITSITSFFIPGVYYEKLSGSYQIAYNFGGAGYTYYSLHNITPLEYPFYEGNKYFWFNPTTQLYEIDKSNIMVDSHKPYYKGTPLYVFSDFTERWNYGYEWPEQALYVPASVTLATREKVKMPYEITDIDNGTSSINGSILTLHKMIDKNNDGTRDLTSISGAINATKDVLQAFHLNLIPKRILYVNDFGQITTSSITIDQLKQLIN